MLLFQGVTTATTTTTTNFQQEFIPQLYMKSTEMSDEMNWVYVVHSKNLKDKASKEQP